MCVCVCSYTNFNVIRLVWHTKDEPDWWMAYNKFLIIAVERELLCDKLFYNVFLVKYLLNATAYRVCLLWFTEPFQLAFKSFKPVRQHIIALLDCYFHSWVSVTKSVIYF